MSLMFRLFQVFAAASFLLLSLSSESYAGEQFRWHASIGDQFAVVANQEMSQVLTVEDKTFEIPNSMKMWMTWTVTDVSETGSITITQTFDRISMTTKVPNLGELKYDSDSKEEPIGAVKKIADILKPMVGAKFVQRMTDRGMILDLRVPREALQGMNASPLLKQFFSDDSFKEMMMKVSPVFPGEEIEKGHSWEANSTNATPVGNMIVDSKYIYEGEEERDGKSLAKISSTVKLSFEEGKGPAGTDIKITEQDNSGTAFFDAQAGHFVDTTMTQDITMEVSVNGSKVDQKIVTKLQMTMSPIEN